MEMRELRRQLKYQLAIGETLLVNGVALTRESSAIVAAWPLGKRRFKYFGNLEHAIDQIVSFVEQVQTVSLGVSDPATLTRREVLRLNRQLAQIGYRCCATCRKVARRDDGTFYSYERVRNGRNWTEWRSNCAACETTAALQRHAKRMANPSKRAARNRANRVYRRAHKAENAAAARRYRQRQRVANAA